MSDEMCAVVCCVCVSFAWEVGVYFVLRCLHEPFLLYLLTLFQVDISYYPYDHQKCGIEVVSWGYTIDEVSLEAITTEINLEDFE